MENQWAHSHVLDSHDLFDANGSNALVGDNVFAGFVALGSTDLGGTSSCNGGYDNVMS